MSPFTSSSFVQQLKHADSGEHVTLNSLKTQPPLILRSHENPSVSLASFLPILKINDRASKMYNTDPHLWKSVCHQGFKQLLPLLRL